MRDGIANARIIGTTLGPEDHGIFTSFITCDFGGTVQGFGGYGLSTNAAQFILGVLQCAGTDEWGELKGKPVRVCRIDGLLRALGHFIEDKWLYFDQVAQNWRVSTEENTREWAAKP